jgi:hypothetical protein
MRYDWQTCRSDSSKRLRASSLTPVGSICAAIDGDLPHHSYQQLADQLWKQILAGERQAQGRFLVNSQAPDDAFPRHDLAAEKRGHDLRAGKVADRAGERVTVGDDEVGVVAGFE